MTTSAVPSRTPSSDSRSVDSDIDIDTDIGIDTDTDININIDTDSEAYESWGNFLNRIDESLSRPVFRCGLPKWVELVFSVPSHCFGMNSTLTLGPLWIAHLALSQQQGLYDKITTNEITRMLLLKTITISITALYVVAWGCFQIGDCHGLGIKLFWNPKLNALSFPWSVGVLAYTVLGLQDHTFYLGSSSHVRHPEAIFSMAIYPLALWPLVIFGVSHLKTTTRRSRPCKKDHEAIHSENWIKKKKFPTMTTIMVRYNGDASFPSGDVAMAALLAVPLWNIERCGGLALAIVVLSGLGRMYVLAHHLGDVLAGALITVGVHGVATAFGCGMYQMKWWYPFLTMGGYKAFERWNKRHENHLTKQGGGTDRTDSKED